MSTSEQLGNRQRQLSSNAPLYFRIFLAVVVVVAGLWGYNRYFVHRAVFELPKATNDVASGKPLFTGDDFAAVSAAVSINGTQIQLQKDDAGDWRVVTPLKDLGDTARIDELVTGVENLRYGAKEANVSDLAQFGLDKPWLTATIKGADRSVSIDVGSKNIDGSYNVLVAGDTSTVYRVGNIAPTLLSLRPFDLVRENLLTFENADVQSLVVSEPGMQPLSFQRNANGDWTSTLNQQKDPVVVYYVDEFLQGLKYVSATGIADGHSSDAYGFYPADGSIQISMTTKAGKTLSLNLGKLTDDGRHYYAAASGRDHTYEVVQFVPDNLRSRLKAITTHILDFNPDNLDQIDVQPTPTDYRTLTSAANYLQEMTALQYIQVQQSIGVTIKTDKVSYVNENGTWKSNGTVAFGLAGLMHDLSMLQVYSSTKDADDKTLGFTKDQGSYTVSLTFKDNTLKTFTIGSDAKFGDKDATYVFASNQPGVWVAPADIVKQIKYAMTHVRQSMLQFKPEDAVEIHILQGSNTAVLKLNGSDWLLDGAKKSADTVNAVLKTLSNLNAESLVPIDEGQKQGGFYPAAGGIRVEVILKDGSTQTLDIGAKKQIGTGWFASYDYYVKSADFEDVGIIPDSSMEETLNQINELSH